MKGSLLALSASLAIIAAIVWPRPQFALSDRDEDHNEVSRSYQAYVQAWKSKDIAALEKLISNDYMAMNYENRLSTKELELATAKDDLAWNAMTKIDLTKLGLDFRAPVFLFEGRHDPYCPPSLIWDYHESIKAPHKEFVGLKILAIFHFRRATEICERIGPASLAFGQQLTM
jgi:pimeloyl-ACP methyl ester carboxylesterase